MKTHSPKPLGHSKGSHKREVDGNPGLPKEGRKVSNIQPNLIPQRTGKRTVNKAQNLSDAAKAVIRVKYIPSKPS